MLELQPEPELTSPVPEEEGGHTPPVDAPPLIIRHGVATGEPMSPRDEVATSSDDEGPPQEAMSSRDEDATSSDDQGRLQEDNGLLDDSALAGARHTLDEEEEMRQARLTLARHGLSMGLAPHYSTTDDEYSDEESFGSGWPKHGTNTAPNMRLVRAEEGEPPAHPHQEDAPPRSGPKSFPVRVPSCAYSLGSYGTLLPCVQSGPCFGAIYCCL